MAKRIIKIEIDTDMTSTEMAEAIYETLSKKEKNLDGTTQKTNTR